MSDEVVVKPSRFASALKRRANSATGREHGLAAAVRDRTAALTEARFRDELTGLFNRAMLTEALSQRIESKPEGLALLAVGLQQIEVLRESHGQEAADTAFKAVAERLDNHVRAADVLARVGEHTLVLLLGQVPKQDQAAAIAKRVLVDLSAPILAAGTQIYVNAGIGVSMYPEDCDNAVTLINNAEAALRRTQPPGDAVCFYSRAFNVESQERLTIESALRRAVAENALQLHYQPRIGAATGQIFCVEALLRWRDEEHGQVSPVLFVPLLETTGLIVQVGKWVIQEATRTLARWHAVHPQIQVSVNVSALQFRGPSVAELICDSLRNAGMSPDCGLLEVELTESLLMSEGERHHLHELAEANIPLAIDDFGTGYSALSYLLDMPFDVLKVDRSFVTRLPSEPHVSKVMHAIVAMAHALDMTVVAEGVETQEEFDQLVELECDQIQGYLTGRPMPSADLDGLLHLRD